MPDSCKLKKSAKGVSIIMKPHSANTNISEFTNKTPRKNVLRGRIKHLQEENRKLKKTANQHKLKCYVNSLFQKSSVIWQKLRWI